MPKRKHDAANLDTSTRSLPNFPADAAPWPPPSMSAQATYVKRGILAQPTPDQFAEMLRVVAYSADDLASSNKHAALQAIWLKIGHHCKIPVQSRYSNKRVVAQRLLDFASANLEYHGIEVQTSSAIATNIKAACESPGAAIEVD
jgi:hypothetical protein